RVPGAAVAIGEYATRGAEQLNAEESTAARRCAPVGCLQAVWCAGQPAGAIGVAPVAVRRAAGHRDAGEVAVGRVVERPVVPQRVLCDHVAGGGERASEGRESPAPLAVGVWEAIAAVDFGRGRDAVGTLAGDVVFEHQVVLSAPDADAGTEEHRGCSGGDIGVVVRLHRVVFDHGADAGSDRLRSGHPRRAGAVLRRWGVLVVFPGGTYPAPRWVPQGVLPQARPARLPRGEAP